MKRGILIGITVVVIGLAAGVIFYRTYSRQGGDATFGGVSLKLEYATTTPVQERGLGGRSSIPDHYGMLFVFGTASRYGFWMKDMLVPIDIFWLDGSLRVVSVSRDVSPSTYPDVFYPPVPVRFVLETAAGFARANNIATGTPLIWKDVIDVSK